MDWLSIDTDMPDDPKIIRLRRELGPEAPWYYIVLLADIAHDIDLDNDENGYLDTGGDDPAEYLAWRLRIDPDEATTFLETCADITLIDEDEYDSGRIFVPKLLERTQTQEYLKFQKAGRKGGEKSPKTQEGHNTANNGKQNKPPQVGPLSPPYPRLEGVPQGGFKGCKKEKNNSKKKEVTETENENKTKTVASSSLGSSEPRSLDGADAPNSDDDWKGERMAGVREWAAESFSGPLESAVTNAFGKLLYKAGFSDRELRWIFENEKELLVEELLKAETQNEVFAYFNQTLNSTIRPALAEARLWKDDEQSHEPSALDEMIRETFGGPPTDPDDDSDFSRVEMTETLQEEFGDG